MRWPCSASPGSSWLWASRGWGRRAGLYAGLGVLTSIGPFLFTRFVIPEALLSFLLLFALWSFITGLESRRPIRFYGMWAALALATLTKGLIAPVFFVAAADSLPAAHRPMAPLARVEARHRHAALSRHRRALAHPLRPRQS